MSVPDDFLYEYAVVRCVPRIHRDEFLNIGLIMLCKRRKWMKGKIEIIPGRLLALDPGLNLKDLEKQASIFEIPDLPFANFPVEEKYRWLTAVKSSVIQTSPSHPGIIFPDKCLTSPAEMLEIEFNRLFSELVSSL